MSPLGTPDSATNPGSLRPPVYSETSPHLTSVPLLYIPGKYVDVSGIFILYLSPFRCLFFIL